MCKQIILLYRKCAIAILLLCTTALGSIATADEHDAAQIENVIEKVTRIETNLESWFYGEESLADISKALVDYKTLATDCTASAQASLDKVENEIKRLGEDTDTKEQSGEVAEQLRAQREARDAAKTRLSKCTALGLHVDKVHKALQKEVRRQLETKMLARGTGVRELVAQNLRQPVSWLVQSLQHIRDKSWLHNEANWLHISVLIVVVLLAILAGLFLRRRAQPWAASRPWENSRGGRFACSFLVTSFNQAPQLLGVIAFALAMWVLTRGLDPGDMLAAFAYGLAVVAVTQLFIQIFLNPVAPGQVLVDIEPEYATKLATRLNVMVLLLFFGFILLGTLVGASLPEYVHSLARRVLRFLLAINTIWVLWLFRHLSGLLRQGWFRHSLTLVVVIAAIADLIGYYNLAGWLFRSVFGTLLVFWLISMVAGLSREFFAGLEYAKRPWQQRVRRSLGLPTTDRLAGFFWLRVLVNTVLWILLLWLLVLIWDVSSSALNEFRGFLREGFYIGFLHIVPTRVILALLAIAALIALTSWVKGVMKTRLANSPMERGTREALVTITGYVGVVVAILVALGVAGIEFANIAIVAGALSVGIGFGLQNIVNNFVSGLILLFERPIKTGDWIVVGNTEGYVEKIRIRSTQIRTFDRADVIIPNSELISSQVTNWMLSDSYGRISVPVGVAYGTNTEQVKDILLNIATENTEILNDKRAPKPSVLFLGFGDSSLNFELRCFIKNIDQRFRITSDVNFAIDKAFRDAGIEIPFPQRDVHLYTDKSGGSQDS